MLGQMLVAQIPTDPERYKQWLENERAIYAKITEDLEGQALTVTNEVMLTYWQKIRAIAAWRRVDERLLELPSALGIGVETEVEEWTYTFNLDTEIFSVNMQIHFHMNNIPRDRWVEAFKPNDHGQTVFSFDNCPEGETTLPIIEYFADDYSRDEYKAKYQQYNCSMVRAPSRIEESSKTAHRQIIAVVMFQKFMSSYAPNFGTYLPEWSHNDFALRESAFAILSLAAGQYRFDEPERLDGEIGNGYLIDVDDEDLGDNGRGNKPREEFFGARPKSLPLFASGCHCPGEEAGSAPQASIYWFENILVSLVPDIVIQNDTEAAIAKVVEFGLKEGKLNFHVVVFSLVNVVMLQVLVQNGVTAIKRTEAVELESSIECSEEVDSLEAYCRRRAGFISLVHFFDGVANQHLSLFNQGYFPTEIYEMILANADEYTYNACAKASRNLRALSQRGVLFGKDLMLIKFSAERHTEQQKWKFTFLDRNTGQAGESGLDEKGITASYGPIIGSERPSIMTEIKLPFSTRSKPMQKKSYGWAYPRSPYQCTLESNYMPWEIPRNALVAQVGQVWVWYLYCSFQGRDRGLLNPWAVTENTFTCTLIPHYLEIAVTYCLKRNLRVCLRRFVDGDTPQKRAETLAYITARHSKKAEHGDQVIVVFGANIRLYEWRRRDDSDEWLLERRVDPESPSLRNRRYGFELKTLLRLKQDWESLGERDPEYLANFLTSIHPAP
ncbi:MAG: hypothetical protein M1840_002076 [Geoglossum simile]|nr:MAG: hypothetical protein M1840_002076 [Geoglossum simile]